LALRLKSPRFFFSPPEDVLEDDDVDVSAGAGDRWTSESERLPKDDAPTAFTIPLSTAA
jgi:hypothetical protein